MRNMMGIILTGGKSNHLKEIAEIRSTSAIPVAGKYRAIDFPLSNMVNSGVSNIGVLTQYSFRSLMDHLGSGKEWDLDRRNKGLFVFPPYLTGDEYGWYRGSADAMHNNITFFERSVEEYVVLSQGNCVYKIDFNRVLDFHLEKKADITIVYRNMDDYPPEELVNMGNLTLDEQARIIRFEEKPVQPTNLTCSTGIYILKRELLIQLLKESYADGRYDFVRDILVKKVDDLLICGYCFEGYWRHFSTVQGYYRCNMEMLQPDLQKVLFIDNGHIYTKVKDEPPAKFNDEAEVKNSIVADGCIVEGMIENSVIFRDVTIQRGAIIRNSIVMQGTIIQEEAVIESCIIDKDVVVTKGKVLEGTKQSPVIIEKDARV